MVKYLDMEELYDDSIKDDDHPEVKNISKGGAVKSKNTEKRIDNPDLRLINDYFKEVAHETLLTPKEEVAVSAGICN